MTTEAERALADYEALYRSPRTGEYIIDGAEAQVAADLAKALRAVIAATGNTPDTALQADFRQALREQGLPESSTLADLIRHHRGNAGLATALVGSRHPEPAEQGKA